jgi:PAS domain S-box-containing protein
LRYIRVNDEFCRFVGASREEILGRRIVEGPAGGLDRDMVERVLTEQVLASASLVDWPAERTIEGVRRVYAWSAFRIADNGRIVGAVGWLIDITERERATADLERARARLDLLARASSQIGTSRDIRQTCAELADLAVPELADRIAIDLLDQVLRGEDPGRDQHGSTGFVRLRLGHHAGSPRRGTQQISTRWIGHTTLTCVERNFRRLPWLNPRPGAQAGRGSGRQDQGARARRRRRGGHREYRVQQGFRSARVVTSSISPSGSGAGRSRRPDQRIPQSGRKRPGEN